MSGCRELMQTSGVVLVFDCFIFFFKQKTAYEIYQCDWSSDVCSSDLEPIWYWQDLAQQHEDILEAAAWIEPAMRDLACTIDRFPDVYQQGLQEVGLTLSDIPCRGMCICPRRATKNSATSASD